MVHKIILAAAFIAISFSAQAQKLNEKELMGSWHMVIDIDAAIKIIFDEKGDEDDRFKMNYKKLLNFYMGTKDEFLSTIQK